jgi:hypothetical protein
MRWCFRDDAHPRDDRHPRATALPLSQEVRARLGEPRRVPAVFAAILRDASLRDAPQDNGRVCCGMGLSTHIKDKAGDDEHCRHRQRLRERFRGSPFGGFLHALLPRPGHDSSLREHARDSQTLYSEHPTTSIRSDESPLSEYRRCQTRIVLRRDFGSPAAGLCSCHDVFGRTPGLNVSGQASGVAISSRSVNLEKVISMRSIDPASAARHD